MDIPRDLRPAEPAVRKRAGEIPARGPAASHATPASSASAADAVNFGDAGAIERYVSVLKTMDPANLHKVEDLRARIADGSYTADPEELADLLLADRREPPAGRRPG